MYFLSFFFLGRVFKRLRLSVVLFAAFLSVCLYLREEVLYILEGMIFKNEKLLTMLASFPKGKGYAAQCTLVRELEL